MSRGKTFVKYEDEDLQRKFKISFLKNNRNTYSKFEEALEKGDLDLAYRLIHSIKGNAGQAKMKSLAKISAEIEVLLKSKQTPIPKEKMQEFKNKLERAIAELEPLLCEEPQSLASEIQKEAHMLDAKQVIQIFTKLRTMLEENDSECLELLYDLKRIQGTEELVTQIEQYDFSHALKTLESLDRNN